MNKVAGIMEHIDCSLYASHITEEEKEKLLKLISDARDVMLKTENKLNSLEKDVLRHPTKRNW